LYTFAPNVFRTTFSNQENIEGFAKVNNDEIDELSNSLDQKLRNVENSQESNATLTITEKEILASILKSANLPASTNVGIDIRPGSMVVALPFNDIWNSVKNNPNIQGQMNGFDPSAFFSNANLTMELGTTPDNKGIVVKNIATGNPLIDDLISDQFSSVSSFDPSNQMSFDNGFNIQRIEFRQDEIVIDLVR